MPKWDPAPQGSPGWHKARLGCLSASRMGAVMKKLKSGKDSADRIRIRTELVAERMTDSIVSHLVSKAMRHGTFWENRAREVYQIETGEIVRQCGFALHDEIEFFGASPDGLIGKDGLLEIKCPTITTHMGYLMGKIKEGEYFQPIMPPDYIPQMLCQLAVTKRKWCDFVTFFPAMSDVESLTPDQVWEYKYKIEGIREDDDYEFVTVAEGMNIKIWRFEPTKEEIEKCEEAAREFLAEVDFIFDAMVMGRIDNG